MFSPDELLQPDEAVLVLIQDGGPGPVEEQHHVLQTAQYRAVPLSFG